MLRRWSVGHFVDSGVLNLVLPHFGTKECPLNSPEGRLKIKGSEPGWTRFDVCQADTLLGN